MKDLSRMSVSELEQFIKDETPLKEKRMNEAYNAPDVFEFQRLSELACYPIWKANQYLKLKKENVELKPHNKNGCLFSMTDFIENVEGGGFIDEDGYGYYSTLDEQSDIIIKPSDVIEGMYRKDFDFVKWYNR